MAVPEPRFHNRFRCPFYRTATLGWLNLCLWVFTILGLWRPVPLEAQQAQADREPIYELRFEADEVRVVHNVISQTRREAPESDLDTGRAKGLGQASSEPPLTHFPFPVVANNQAKKLVWFNADGTIKAQRSIPESRKALVSNNGAYVLLVDGTGYATESGFQSVELLDAQGTRLWEAVLPYSAYLSPTGETVVSVRKGAMMEWADFSIWGQQGKLVEYETGVKKLSFSADGQFLLVAELMAQDITCVSLFDKNGQRLWKRHCQPHTVQSITDVFISKSGRFMAYAYYTSSTSRYLAVLDQNGDMLWTRSGTVVWDIAFSEEDELIATLQETEGGSAYDREIVVANGRTGDAQRRFATPRPEESPIGGYTQLSFLRNDNLLLRYYQRTSDGDILAHLQLFDPTGVLSWESTINPDTEDWNSVKPSWQQKGLLLGVSMGRVFQLFDLSRHDLSEE